MSGVTFSVFTKPWKLSLPELGKLISGLGFDGIELPVRPGYPVTPENMTTELPNAVRILGEHNLKITSIAGPTDETSMAACKASGIPIIRICSGADKTVPYMESEKALQRYLESLVPLLEKHQVTLGFQNHYGLGDVCNAMCLRHLIEKYPAKQIAAVWDAGHTGLEGEQPEAAIDIVWSHLCMVNFKSAFWRRTNGPEAPVAEWEAYWTTGREGRANWPRVASELRRRRYRGVICLTAEYTDEPAVDRLVAEDIVFARSLFDE